MKTISFNFIPSCGSCILWTRSIAQQSIWWKNVDLPCRKYIYARSKIKKTYQGMDAIDAITHFIHMHYENNTTQRDANSAGIKIFMAYLIIMGLYRNQGLTTIGQYVILPKHLSFCNTCHEIIFKIFCGTSIFLKTQEIHHQLVLDMTLYTKWEIGQKDSIKLPNLQVHQNTSHLNTRSDSLQVIRVAMQEDDKLALLKHTIILWMA